MIAVVIENSRKESSNIFDHHSFGPNLVNEPDCRWKKIALVFLPKLLACHGKWRTRQTRGENINALVRTSIKDIHICRAHVPIRSVEPQRLRVIRLYLDQRLVPETGKFKPQRLTARSCTKFNGIHGQPRPRGS